MLRFGVTFFFSIVLTFEYSAHDAALLGLAVSQICASAFGENISF